MASPNWTTLGNSILLHGAISFCLKHDFAVVSSVAQILGAARTAIAAAEVFP
jgi:hypothetical protein